MPLALAPVDPALPVPVALRVPRVAATAVVLEGLLEASVAVVPVAALVVALAVLVALAAVRVDVADLVSAEAGPISDDLVVVVGTSRSSSRPRSPPQVSPLICCRVK